MQHNRVNEKRTYALSVVVRNEGVRLGAGNPAWKGRHIKFYEDDLNGEALTPVVEVLEIRQVRRTAQRALEGIREAESGSMAKGYEIALVGSRTDTYS